MIVHNILFKLKDKAHIPEAVAKLQGMAGQIPELAFIEVGIDQVGSNRSFHIALLTKFKTWADLDSYQTHPVHTPVIEYMSNIIENVAVVDYEEA